MARKLVIAAAIALVAGGAGCKKKGGAADEAPPDKVVQPDEIVGMKGGKEKKPPEPDFEQLFKPPACLDPQGPDPLGGAFPVEKALEGLAGKGNPVATIKTSMGTLTCELFADKAPATVANFVGLARGLRSWWNPRTCAWVTKPFYDGLVFHRVIPQFMIQGGDPLGNGTGSPGYRFADELDASLRHDAPGIMSMANAGPGTNGSQFFILDKWDDADGPPKRLDGKHAVFGLCSPADIVFKIARVPQTGKPHNRPLEDVVITSVTVARKEM